MATTNLSSNPELEMEVTNFLTDLSFNKLIGSQRVAMATLELVKKIIGKEKWSSTEDLIGILKKLGSCDQVQKHAQVGNLLKRVLKLVREEHTNSVQGGKDLIVEAADTQESLHKLVLSNEDPDDFSRVLPKHKVIESIDELIMEIETASDEISSQALGHIHANEIILTIGRSRTVELFLKQAAKERKFQVIVAECSPSFQGHEMANSLAKSKIQTTVITDSAIFAVMSRVNKVIIGTNAVLADGGLVAVTGTYTVALSAKHYSVPFYVCASAFKLTPQYAFEQYNKFVSPQETFRTMEGQIASRLNTVTPAFEYVPPELVTLFVSNLSDHSPSYVYRLLGELYHPKDYVIQGVK